MMVRTASKHTNTITNIHAKTRKHTTMSSAHNSLISQPIYPSEKRLN